MRSIVYHTFLVAGMLLAAGAAHAGQPLKVFVLAGQSNMEGKAKARTIARLALSPETASIYKDLTGAEGKYEVAEVDGGKYTVVPDTCITYLGAKRGHTFPRNGKLSAGFGSGLDQIGPEYTFGFYMHQHLQEPILIIKTAWGGKSLIKDFRPPSAGPYPYEEGQAEQLAEKKKTTVELINAETGKYYRDMIAYVRKVLADPGKYHPAYDKDAGYEIDGFVWFQGWNDMVGPYPSRAPDPGQKRAGKDYAEYSRLLACFIRDVRKDLEAPRMPFVIGVLGVGGPKPPDDNMTYFRKAMAAPATMPEFKGTVAAVLTEQYWDMKAQALDDRINEAAKKAALEEHPDWAKRPAALRGAVQKAKAQVTEKVLSEEERSFLAVAKSNAGYHYNGSAYTFARMGKGFADAMAELLEEGGRGD